MKLRRSSAPFPSHPPDVLNSVIHQLKSRGFFRARRFCTEYPLELIVEAMIDVDAMIDDGILVRNPTGLRKVGSGEESRSLVRRLYEQYPNIPILPGPALVWAVALVYPRLR